MRHFDYIITGGGCAGLSLVYQLLQSPLQHKSVLIIEKEDKNQNDRTWCFWEKEIGVFEEIVYHQWSKVNFFSTNYSQLLDIAPYRYKMIRGIDFYQFVKDRISVYTNVVWIKGNVEQIQDNGNGATVTANGEKFTADWIFNSIRKKENDIITNRSYYMLQHFKGWVIETDIPCFNPQEATLMDFRIDQHKETRFIYVLPTNNQTALIEFTVFSQSQLPNANYDIELIKYITDYLKIKNYRIRHEEFGIIPMTDYPFPDNNEKPIINLGTAGGQTKASTGYTFTRIQQHTQALIKALTTTGKPYYKVDFFHKRFRLYDSTLLNVLLKERLKGKEVFTLLFKNNKPDTVLRFLEEKTNFIQELKILNSVPRIPFIKGMADSIVRIFILILILFK